jgi:hypothetical protein
MYDLEIILENRPGQLALMGQRLGDAGVSIEGGGMFLVGDQGVAHFLFENGPLAQSALESVGMRVTGCREVLVQRLKQDEPGQLGQLCQRIADAGVNIEVLYSDHNHHLILVVDDPLKGQRVSDEWMRQRQN